MEEIKKMVKKRVLSLLVAIILALSGITYAGGIAATPDSGGVDVASIQFFGEAARLLRGSGEEDTSYISSIMLTLDSDIMVVNGNEITVAPPNMTDGSKLLPIADIAEALGAQVDIDNMHGEITIADDGEVTVLDTPSDAGNIQLYDIHEVADVLTLDFNIDGGDITLTRPFQSKMLLVRMHTGKTLPDTYGAIDYITDNNGRYVLKYDSISQAKEAYEEIEALPECKNIAPDLILFILDDSVNGDFSASTLPTPSWGADRIHADLMKKYLENNGKTVSDITVAVIDTGIETTHPFFAGRMVPGRNFAPNSPTDITNDTNGHGTHVAGIVVDCTPGNVKIMPVKAFQENGLGPLSSVAEAIKWAVDNGAKVINMSFGATNLGTNPNWDIIMREACQYAIDRGVATVAAAGNPTNYGEAPSDTANVTPARLSTVITVSATDKDDLIAGFSNYGDAIDISAPGVGIMSSWLGGVYCEKSGTSMSAPHVSAAAAMLSLDNPSLGFEGLKSALQSISVDAGEPGKDRIYGWGILNFSIYDAFNHVWASGATVGATCTEQGYTTYTCSHCNTTENRYITPINPDAHSFTGLIETVAATCAAQGYTSYKCSRCDAAENRDFTPADPSLHSFTELIGTVAATCVAQGYTSYKCIRCEALENRDLAPADPSFHSFTELVGTVAATCTFQGFNTYKCIQCDATVNRDFTPTTDHLWNSGTVTIPPTADSEGLMTFICTLCDVTRTVTIPAIEAKSISVGQQSGTLTAGAAGTVRFSVTAANIKDGKYTAAVANLPGGITVEEQVSIANNSGTLTLSGSKSTVAGTTSILTLTIDSATSSAFSLMINAPAPVDPSPIDKISPPTGGGLVTPPTGAGAGSKTEDDTKTQEEIKPQETPLTNTVSFTPFINGYPDKTIRGADTMSREEFVNILFKLNNPDKLPEADTSSRSFNDVAPGRWSFNAIEWAAGAGIIDADNQGNFRPAAKLTRAEMAVMLMKAEGWTKLSENIFSDTHGHPHNNAIRMAVEAGIFIGYPDGTFKPDNTAIRAEVITALVRYLLGGEPTDEMWVNIQVTFTDMPRSHWAYKYVALATTGYTMLPK